MEHGLQAMLDLLTDYLGNAATRTEWLTEIQRRFTRNGKLRQGWSDDSIDRKITKLEKLGLITGGRGRGEYYSAVTAVKQTGRSHHSGACDVSEPAIPALARRLPAAESFVDALKAAKLQLLNRGKPPAA
jgi:hypothetical protein